MKIKDGYMLKKVMGSFMIISTEDSVSNQMQTMNETGAFLWNLLSEDTTKEKMLQTLVSEYEVDFSTAENDIDAFIAKLESSNLLEK